MLFPQGLLWCAALRHGERRQGLRGWWMVLECCLYARQLEQYAML